MATIVLALITAAGAAARFVGLGLPFWYHDEATTSLRISGYRSGDVQTALSDRFTTARGVLRYQSVGARAPMSSIESLAREDPQHPPLFYTVARAWAATVGDSIASLRALAALLSLLTFPAVYWLARELFGWTPVAWVSIALVAVSPFQLLYAQVAREYALWGALTAAASAALLRASRRGSAEDWALYSMLLAAGLFTYPLTAGVVLGHAVFVLVERCRLSARTLVPFAASVLAAGVVFSPWLYVMAAERGAFAAGTHWASEPASPAVLGKAWLVEVGLPFLDNPAVSRPFTPGTVALALGLVALVLAALAKTVLSAPRRATVFLCSLLAGSTLPLVGADLAGGGIRSTVPRFVVPAMVALELPTAFLICSLIDSRVTRARAAGAALAGLVLGCALGSFAERSGTPVWWTHDDGAAAENVALSRVVNSGRRPALVTTSSGNLLELAHYLRPEATIFLASGDRLPPVTGLRGRSPIVLYGSATGGGAAQRLGRLLHLIRRYGGGRLVRLSPPLPCCGAGIRWERGQLWRWRLADESRAAAAGHSTPNRATASRHARSGSWRPTTLSRTPAFVVSNRVE